MNAGITASVATASLYAAVFAIIGIWLGVIVGQWRQREKVLIGDGGKIDLIRAMRGQANFIETVPMVLILFFAMALLGAPYWVIHLFGAQLVVARIVHGLHFSKPGQPGWQRAIGAAISILVTILAAIGVAGHAIYAMMQG
ncbi:MAG: MAPEG family protein [Nitratireductor sp.]